MSLRTKLLASLQNPPAQPSPLPPPVAQSAALGSTATASTSQTLTAPDSEPAPPKASAPKSKRPTILVGVDQVGAWLRNEAKEILAAKVSEKTQAQHLRNGGRLAGQRVDGEAIDLTKYQTTSTTFYAYRAAVRYHAATRGQEALQAYDAAKKAKDDAASAEAWQRVLYAAADLKTHAGSVPGLSALDLHKAGAGTESGPAKAKREGRRAVAKRETSKLTAANSIAKKYPDWRERLWGQLVEFKSPWLDHTAVAGLTGARPEELRTAKFQRVNGLLCIEIQGAKVSATKGQEWRRFTLGNDGSSEFAHLFNKAGASWQKVGMPDGVKDYPDAFSAALARAGQKALPKADRMSGYVYRHALASDLKADGFTREQIAAALGHAVTKTQDTYGRATGGSSGKRKLSVECAKAIKVTHDTRYTNDTPPQAAPLTMTLTTPNYGSFGL